jgi:hypothetical protein
MAMLPIMAQAAASFKICIRIKIPFHYKISAGEGQSYRRPPIWPFLSREFCQHRFIIWLSMPSFAVAQNINPQSWQAIL